MTKSFDCHFRAALAKVSIWGVKEQTAGCPPPIALSG